MGKRKTPKASVAPKPAIPAEVSKCASALGKKGAAARWKGHKPKAKGSSKRARENRGIISQIRGESGLVVRRSGPLDAERLPADRLGRSLTVADVAAIFRRPLQLGPGRPPAPAAPQKAAKGPAPGPKAPQAPVELGRISEPPLPRGYNAGSTASGPAPRWLVDAVLVTGERLASRETRGPHQQIRFELSKDQAAAVRELAGEFASTDPKRPHLGTVNAIRYADRLVLLASDGIALAIHVEEGLPDFGGPAQSAIIPRAAAKSQKEGSIRTFVNDSRSIADKASEERMLREYPMIPAAGLLESILRQSEYGNTNSGGGWVYLPENLGRMIREASSGAKASGRSPSKKRDPRKPVMLLVSGSGDRFHLSVTVLDPAYEPEAIGRFETPSAVSQYVTEGSAMFGLNAAIVASVAAFCSMPSAKNVEGKKVPIGTRLVFGSNYLDPMIAACEPRPGRVGRLVVFMPARA